MKHGFQQQDFAKYKIYSKEWFKVKKGLPCLCIWVYRMRRINRIESISWS